MSRQNRLPGISPRAVGIAEVINEARPADGVAGEWRAGCDSARDYIARRMARKLKLDREERAEFFKRCDIDGGNHVY